MKNEEIVKKLNDETYKYLLKVNEIANFFYKNKTKIKINEYNKEKDIQIIRNLFADEIVYFSSLFAIMQNNKIIKNKFKEYGVTCKNLFDKFNIDDNNLRSKFVCLLNDAVNNEKINRINLDNIFNNIYYSYENEGEDKFIKKNDKFYKQMTPSNIHYSLEDSESSMLFNNILKYIYELNSDEIMYLYGDLDDIFDMDISIFLDNIDMVNETFNNRYPIIVFVGFIIYKDNNNNNYYLKFDDIDNLNSNLIASIKKINNNRKVKVNFENIKNNNLKIKSINGNIIGPNEGDMLSKLYSIYDEENDTFNIVVTYNNIDYEISIRKSYMQSNGVAEDFDRLKEIRYENELEKNPKYKIDKRYKESFLIIDEKDKKYFKNKMKNTSTDNYIIINESDNDESSYDDENILNKDDDLNLNYLKKYGFDLTKENYLKDPSVSRDDVLKRIEQILLYPEKDKSIILTGRSGCGKTSIVKGLAYRIQKGEVPNELKNLRIFSINTSSLVAGTKYVGTLQEKMEKILSDASKSKDILLFIDEIHQTIGAGKSENDENSVSEILKPYLDTGRVRVIGATTDIEYEKYITEDEAYKTRFKRVSISEPTNDVIYQILNNLIESYNKFSYSKLLVSDEEKDMIIKWLIDSTQEKYRKYNDQAANPRMVLDILKEAYAISAYYNRSEVSIEDIINALLNEDRLYDSSKAMQIKKLRLMKPQKHKCEIIEFKLKK